MPRPVSQTSEIKRVWTRLPVDLLDEIKRLARLNERVPSREMIVALRNHLARPEVWKERASNREQYGETQEFTIDMPADLAGEVEKLAALHQQAVFAEVIDALRFYVEEFHAAA